VTLGQPGGVQKSKLQGGVFVVSLPNLPVHWSSISAVSGSSGLLVGDHLQLIAADETSTSKLTPEAINLADKIGFVLTMLWLCVRYSLLAAVLGLGTTWLMKIHRSPGYLYGKRTASHATVLRRGIARFIDTVITVYPPLFWFAHIVNNESEYMGNYPAGAEATLFILSLMSIFATWIGGVALLSFMQGKWGVTPGKWLCGIRTFRTTLRPCGLLRAVAREMLIYVDGFMLAIWLPGVLSIAFTKNWQRLGDLAADTIVVINPNHQSWLR
jgi:uncharacterized RDD family membrane protein YckC